MPYAQIHTQAIRHRKVLSLSAPAFRLWVAGHCYCQEHLSDGFVPVVALVALGVPVKQTWVRELLVQGLWHATDLGYQVHDWRDWNATREQVETRRKAARDRKAAWVAKQATNAPDDTTGNAVRNAVRNAVTAPVTKAVRNGVRNGSATQRNAEDPDQEPDQDPGLRPVAPCGKVEKSPTPTLVRLPKRPPDIASTRVLAQVAVALLQRQDYTDDADLKEDFKRACAKAHLKYAADDVRKALDQARGILAKQQERHA